MQVALAHSHIIGGGFDLPVTQNIFEEYVSLNGLNDRLRFISGDFFKDPLPNADVLSMGHILHDWNLEEKKQLIGKAFEALPPGGALIIFESLIDDDRRTNTFGLLMSLNMLIELPGGFDYTGADCTGWLREAGFRETRVRASCRAGLDGDWDKVISLVYFFRRPKRFIKIPWVRFIRRWISFSSASAPSCQSSVIKPSRLARNIMPSDFGGGSNKSWALPRTIRSASISWRRNR